MIFQSIWSDIQVPRYSAIDAVLGIAEDLGDKPAVIEGETGQTLVYRELIEGANRVSAGLSHFGLAPGQPVAIALPNSIDFVLACYGAWRAGAWVVPINPACKPAEIDVQIRDSGARYLITVREHATDLKRSVERIFVTEDNWNLLLNSDAVPPDIHVTPDDLAVVPYSSGTTGRPKGVMLTHSNIVANMWQLYATGEVRRDDVIVNFMPLCHAAGLNYVMNTFLGFGATVVLMRRFEFENWLDLIIQYRATTILLVPPVVLAVTRYPRWDGARLDSLRHAGCGAAPLSADLHKAFEERTGLLLTQAWGMTEATCIVAGTPSDAAKRKYGSCGYLLPSCQARVVDVTSGTELGLAEAGEIWLRGPQIMTGYWNQPEATAETLMSDGWMRTGDIGYFDSDGCVYLVDRLKEMIKYKGLQVSPAELEDTLQSHAAVLEAAVVGTPDEMAGEIPTAFVVRRQGAAVDAQELLEYVAARVAPHKKIRAVEFVDQLPKSPTGKVLRMQLKGRARAQRSN
jgi:acyl-CoA synthetase (AMP-forming)/AMP-acid ligase II